MRVELLGAGVADDDRDDALPPAIVRRADHRHLLHPGVAREHVLDLERMHVLAAGDDHVVDPPVDPQVTVLVQVAGVARWYQPSWIAFASASGRFQ